MPNIWTILAAMFLLVLPFAVLEAAEGEAFTDAAAAGPDFAAQGEYVGELKFGDAAAKFGAQVIALGDGKFQLELFAGGLPGDGWKRGDKQLSAPGERSGDAIKFSGADGTGKLVGDKLEISNSGGQSIGTLTKVERKSPTLGAKPPEGAVVLFDGTSVDKFNNGKLTEEKLLLAGAMSKDEFTDFTMHLEFRTPFMPKARGQGRGNSGLYLQNRYEIQVLDSFGLKGENNECGGLYSLKSPAVNMCLPPLAWQTYDIDFKAAKFDGDKKTSNACATIKHNGVVIYDDMELPGITPGGAGAEAPGKGPFQLQWHGNPVAYRNFWVQEKK